MRKYFGVNLEFNHSNLESIVEEESVNGKGYCCFIDATSLVHSYKNEKFNSILNSSLVNSCDGSYIAFFAGKIHNKVLREYTGPDFFNKFIYNRCNQIIIGNTSVVFNKVKLKLELGGADASNIFYIPLPFKLVNEFDYEDLARKINLLEPRFIWVSLGAPKQEEFMFNLLPLIDRGVMMGIGAALNFFTGEIRDIPYWARKTHLIWLYRIFVEPQKQIKRCFDIFLLFPRILINEININNSHRKNKF